MNQKWREGNEIPPQRLRGQGVFEDARFTNGHFLVSKSDDDPAVLCVDGGDAHGVGDHDLAE